MNRHHSHFDRIMLVVMTLTFAWMAIIHFRFNHVDYNTFHRAGLTLLQSSATELYSPTQSSMGGFLYPLGAAWFFSGLAWLGEWQGRLVFYSLIAGSLIYATRWCTRNLGSHSRASWLALLLSARSINDCFLSGNVNPLLLALTLLSWQPDRSLSWIRASCFALASSTKIFPAVTGAFWLWNRNWKALGRLLFATAAIFLIPYGIYALLAGSATSGRLIHDWIATLANPGNSGGESMIHFQNLSATFHRISHSLELTTNWIKPALLLLAILLALAPMIRFAKTNTHRAMARDYAVLLTWVPLLSPVTWHHLGIFYLPLLHQLSLEVIQTRNLFKTLRLAAFFVLYTLTGKNVLGPVLHAWISHHSIPILGILAIVIPETLQLGKLRPGADAAT